jgi:phosphotransacetylase
LQVEQGLREATELVQAQRPDLEIDREMRADTAVGWSAPAR